MNYLDPGNKKKSRYEITLMAIVFATAFLQLVKVMLEMLEKLPL